VRGQDAGLVSAKQQGAAVLQDSKTEEMDVQEIERRRAEAGYRWRMTTAER